MFDEVKSPCFSVDNGDVHTLVDIVDLCVCLLPLLCGFWCVKRSTKIRLVSALGCCCMISFYAYWVFFLQSGNGRENWVEESLAVSAIRVEEKKHEQGCWWEHVMGSSNAKTKGGIIWRPLDRFCFTLYILAFTRSLYRCSRRTVWLALLQAAIKLDQQTVIWDWKL